MSNVADYNYTNIENPYNNQMERSGDGLDVAENALMSGGSSGNVEQTVGENTISGSELGDIWVSTWIKSRNYKPKAQGFLLDGATGYIECMKLYAGEGGIVGGSLDIPDEITANSFHVDSSGNTWWGGIDIGTSTASILNTGLATFSNIVITGGLIGGISVSNIAYASTPTADSVPSGLAVDSTAGTYGTTVAEDGTVSAFLTLTWTAISSNTFSHYRLAYKKTANTYYTYVDVATNYLLLDGLIPNTSYTFKIASVNKYGTESSYSSTIAYTTLSSTTRPARVTGVSATGGIQYVVVTWTANSEADIASYNIYRQTYNDSSASILIGNCRTTYFVDGGRVGDTEYFYWIKAVNTSGLLSELYSVVASATPRNTGTTDLVDSAVTAAKTSIAAINPTDGEINYNKVGTLQIDNDAVTEAKLLDAAVTAAKTSLLAIDPLTGSVVADHIATGMIQAGAVIANKLSVLNFMLSEGSFTNDDPDAGKISWADCKVMYSGTEYEITDGNCETTDKHIYWQLATPTVFACSATLPSLGNNDFLVAFNDSGTAIYVWNSTVINGNRITAGSIVASHLAANTITANEIAAGTITAAEIASETITADNISTNAITTDKILTVAGAKVLIDGAVYLSDWRMGGDLTKIDGGEISTGSITTTQLNFTPVQDSDVIASINASEEGITIEAEHINISGSTDFIAAKLDKVGGDYATAESGARVLIFPDANTGVQVYDNSSNEVFKILVGGDNVGDLYFGNYAANNGIFYDKSEGVINIKGKVTIASGSTGVANLADSGALATLSVIGNAYITDVAANKITSETITSQTLTLATTGGTDCKIQAGKTDFTNTGTAGFILGIDNTTPKFYIGDENNYINWNGSSVAIKGSVEITAGSIDEANVTGLADTIADLQDQISGTIESWFYAYDPSNDAAPTDGWIFAATQADHLGDLFYNTETGDAFRYGFVDPDYVWIAITDTTAVQALAAANNAQDTADSKIVTFLQNGIPTSTDTGDLWIDLDDDNKLYRAASIGADEITAGEWVLVRDAGITTALANAATAISDAATAQATADGKVTTFYQDGIPTSEAAGDLWVDTNDGNKLYRAASAAADEIAAGEWVEIQDDDIATAIAAASTAQTTADGKIVSFYATSAPTAEGEGDFWFDTDDGNKLYRWSGSEWVEVSDDNKLGGDSSSAVGGSYASSGSGAAVKIFPTASIGLQVIDGSANNVLLAYVGGAGDPGTGDVIIGDYDNSKGIKWDNSEATFNVKGSILTGSGSTIDGQYISDGTIDTSAVSLALSGWIFTSTFSATDHNTVAWTGGTFTSSDGVRAYTIGASDTDTRLTARSLTSPMNSLVYIYLDTALSTTELSCTYTASEAVGDNRVLIAVAQNNSDTSSYATFQVFGGRGGQNILVDNIVANSAATNTIISNTAQIASLMVTDAKISTCSASKLTAGTISSKTITLAVLEGTGDSKIQAGKTGFVNTGSGFCLGMDDYDNKAKFYIGDATTYFNWDGAGVIIKGGITTSAGSVIDGGYISDGTISSAAANLALRGWTFDGTFSATDYNTVAWTGGTFTSSDETTYTIGASDTDTRLTARSLTSPMNALVYIYLDIALSTTELSCSYTASEAVGNGRVLIAVAENNSNIDKLATFQVFGGSGGAGTTITADNIAANTITGNEIDANTITASHLDIVSLSTITADVGQLTIGVDGYIKGGQTAYDTGTGFFLGYSTDYKFSIGNSAGDKLTWDGSDLTITGSLTINNPENINTSDLNNDAGWTDDTAANAAQGAAEAAQAAAEAAQTDATAALGELDDIADDTKVTPNEKLTAKQRWDMIVVEGAPTTGTIPVQATALSVGDTDFDTAYSALDTYLNTTLGVFSDMETTTTVVRTTWDTAWKNYYDQRTQLLNDIAAKAATLSTWDGVSGANKPADNADVTLTAVNGGLNVTGGGITLDAGGSIKGGQTTYNTGTGFFLGYSTDDYKFSIGDSSDTSKLLLWDGTDLIINDSKISNQDIFGDGNDGDVTISTNTTLTADMYYDDLTVNAATILNTGGYRVFVKGTLTNNGTISRDGNAGTNGEYAGDGGDGGAGGAALADGTLYGGLAGANGGAAGNQSPGAAGSAGDNQTESFANDGSDGGAGGNSGSGTYTGGAGGTGGTKTDTIQPIRNSTFALIMREFSTDDTVTYIKTSAGSGGGGGGAGSNLYNYIGGGGAGAGSSGGIVVLCARKIVNAGTMSANGGAGGNGGNGLRVTSGDGNGGGGGGAGGSGGMFVVMYSILINTGTISAAGGAGGVGGKTGSDGNAVPGEDGDDGDDGLAGTVLYLQV